MSEDPGQFWQDSDDPNWSDEREAQFITALSVWNVENAMRPRDQYDVDIHRESYRGQVLALYDAMDAAMATLTATRRGRFLLRLSHVMGRLRRMRRSASGDSG